MSWRDSLARVTLSDGRELIGASFRGVPFFVETAERQGGRRIVTHEFPLRDDPVVDDLGRRVRVFPVDGYVIGDGYLVERDALLAALEDEAGPGELVHPYYGRIRAICSGLTVRESKDEGGMARFSLEFTGVPTQGLTPTEALDLPAIVVASAGVALAASQAELAEGFDVSGQPSYALASLAADVEAVAEKLGEALKRVTAKTQELATLDVEIQTITSTASSLVRDPVDALEAFAGVLEAVSETAVASPRKVIGALLEAYDVATQPLAEGDTETRQLEAANQAALAGALRQLLAIEAAKLLVGVVYATFDDAIADRDAVADRLEEQAATAGDTAYPALVRLRADVLRAVPGEAALARLVALERRVPVPSLLLSYQLYGSVAQEADILSRNPLQQHPGFVAGIVEVLSSV